jgi:hypothetical protein
MRRRGGRGAGSARLVERQIRDVVVVGEVARDESQSVLQCRGGGEEGEDAGADPLVVPQQFGTRPGTAAGDVGGEGEVVSIPRV